MNADDLRKLSRKDLREMLSQCEKQYLNLLTKQETMKTEYNDCNVKHKDLRNQYVQVTKDLTDAKEALLNVKEKLMNHENRLHVLEEHAIAYKNEYEGVTTIAEASMKVNHVYENVEKAAEDYLKSVMDLSERQEEIIVKKDEESRKACIEQLTATKERSAKLVAETKEQCNLLEKETTAACNKMIQDTDQEISSYKKELSNKLEQFYEEHEGMKEMLDFFHIEIPVYHEEESL